MRPRENARPERLERQERPGKFPPRFPPRRPPLPREGEMVLRKDRPSRTLSLEALKSRQPKKGPDLEGLRELLKESAGSPKENASGGPSDGASGALTFD